MEKRRALFLDRDGVINHDSGYTHRIEDFHFIDGIFDLCRAAQQAGYLIIVVTNQAGIGRGYYTEEDFQVLTTWMVGRFAEEGVTITDVLYCPSHPEHGVGEYKRDSFNRKPQPGMILTAAVSHGLDVESSIMIGDSETDMQAALSAGVKKRYLLIDHSSPNFSTSCTATLLIDDFTKAVAGF
ncbi:MULTISPECIES: HAD family hydrolase [unclassified Janthinobacterium]|uniref:D-glycero-alpha-D-manno-heptose-1,7-bisphosphate 7-phosphatase n=1 Tax=unclassified Janthinobacterium TaxID=2610881 RepID=UPI0022A8CAF1|nr:MULTISPECIES: HAD family hydrolase [unclassified Janthinobacterium]MCC7645226.1 HAD family hydrolase [Janthinobacterium sp. EB271-G4-3-1]MCC7693505.1 HAD family hydrolase [Janthinobacterium sp. EB271-G4-3-2]